MISDDSFTVPGVAGLLRFSDADAVLSAVQEILVGWRLEKQDQTADAPDIVVPDIVVSVRGVEDRWRVSAVTLGKDAWFSDPVAAACSVVANLLQVRMSMERDFLCLHAAAVEIGGGLVVMPSPYRAGKSLLTATLAAAGHRVFNDDVVLIDPTSGEGVAPGIAVRLRVPLPARLDRTTRAFLETCTGPQGPHYRYLDLPETLMARRGERAPIRAFVLLDRRDEGPAELVSIPAGDLLCRLIWQNFARAGAPEFILEALAAQVEQAESLQLSYSDPGEAVQVLVDHLQGKAKAARLAAPAALCRDQAPGADDEKPFDLPPHALLRRSDDAQRFERGGAMFLTSAEGGSILHLNPLACSLWTLLEEPLTYREVLSTFETAFPATARDLLDSDLKHAIKAFAAQGILEIQRQAPAPSLRRYSRAAALALLGAVAFADPAVAFTIEGCEAREISALLAPRGQTTWSGEDRVLGTLRFRHQIGLGCGGESCQVDGGLRHEQQPAGRWTEVTGEAGSPARDRAGTTTVASLPFGSAPPIQLREIGGHAAQQLREAIEQRGYRDEAGGWRYVWVDYGRIAGRINLRARSEIVCPADRAACSLSTAILAHVAYSERDPCTVAPTG